MVRIDFWLALPLEGWKDWLYQKSLVETCWRKSHESTGRGGFRKNTMLRLLLYMSYNSHARALEDVEVECDEY